MTSLDLIRIFLAVAKHRSFSLAAQELAISPTACSKGVRALERRHGVVLFRRTTRSVSLTEPGVSLLAMLKPAIDQIEEAFTALEPFRERPAGRLRITAPRALGLRVARLLVPGMRANYPDVSLDLSLDDGVIDLVAQGYDAGIRLGQSIEQDMVTVRLSRELSWSVVAAPQYLGRHGAPGVPQDLLNHKTIRYRFNSSGLLHAWRFTGPDGAYELETDTALVANDTAAIAEFARQGLGYAYLPDIEIEADLRQGHLVRVLDTFVPKTTGLYLYFPVRTQAQPKMRALIEQAQALAAQGQLDP
ncbi:LysR family transcriptional regulator [Noviherbaspirillum malthae]|uniref:LysR family transcriptional regulator n=1 Tax=Noviherbaspirillum malthae TaxID=1260987 RepID=UPI00188F6342|nr:LysR family transcriptional regulator [Noviherbaspirillum malthae]